jgi:choline dehydrogenase-like flavoprotein
MFIDTGDIPSGSTVQADVCVIGGGAAGIPLALKFADTPVQVVLLESGGLLAEQDGRKIYQVLAGPRLKLAVDPTRPWYFGGTTNHWSGNCRPLDEFDFEPRDWIPHSGWPLRRRELLPYYERAQPMSGLSDFRWYDLDACRPHLEHPPLSVDPAVLTSRILHTCPVRSFAELHRQRLESLSNVRVLLHARALCLKTNAAGDQVCAVEIVGADGRRSRIEAGVFVLACGGVENARLLLCSNDVHRNGLANDHDMVGRFFMEHWCVDIPLGTWGNSTDVVFHVFDEDEERQTVGGASVWAQLALSEELMRTERVPGLSLWLSRTPRTTPSVDSMSRLAASLRGRTRFEQPLTDIQLLLSDPVEVAKHLLRKLGRRDGLPGEGYALRVQIEQTPNPENRVRLSSKQDRFGQPHAELILRLTDEERRACSRSLKIAAGEIGLNGARLVKQMRLMLDAGRLGFFWHHMGTTRMDNDPAKGVVDSNCRVHGVSNLFVASSSVFPTGGTASPTLTIVALALRLADHLRQGRGLPPAT